MPANKNFRLTANLVVKIFGALKKLKMVYIKKHLRQIWSLCMSLNQTPKLELQAS